MAQNSKINQEMNDDELTIDLAELFMQWWNKLHIILLIGILFALVGFFGTKFLIIPKYTSVTKVYVLTRQDSSTGITYNDLQVGTQLTKDYVELVKSRPVLERVIAVLNLDMEPDELAKQISAETQTDTRIIAISVEDENPREAKKIADALREAVSVQITEVTDADSVNMVEDGSLPTKPSSPNTVKNTAIGGMLGIFLVMGIIAFFFITDDTVKTPDDVEKYLGLNVLTSVPVAEEMRKTNRKANKNSAKKHKKN